MKYLGYKNPLIKAIQKMLRKNPHQKVSHPRCDWVVENFMDYYKKFGGTDTKKAREFWNEKNKKI